MFPSYTNLFNPLFYHPISWGYLSLPTEIKKLLTRCLLMQNAELKRVVLALSFSTLRVSELAQITVDDVIMPTVVMAPI